MRDAEAIIAVRLDAMVTSLEGVYPTQNGQVYLQNGKIAIFYPMIERDKGVPPVGDRIRHARRAMRNL